MPRAKNNKESRKWDEIYRHKQQNGETKELKPVYILQEFHHLLPTQGKALDLASGLSANVLFLAQHNMEAYAWDISSTAIEKLQAISSALHLDINTEVRYPPEEYSFDVIVVSHFLDQQIVPKIITALRKNGLLFYQTFTKEHIRKSGPTNKIYRLGKNELLNLCKDLDTVVYREEGLIGDTEFGCRNEALFIGKRN